MKGAFGKQSQGGPSSFSPAGGLGGGAPTTRMDSKSPGGGGPGLGMPPGQGATSPFKSAEGAFGGKQSQGGSGSFSPAGGLGDGAPLKKALGGLGKAGLGLSEPYPSQKFEGQSPLKGEVGSVDIDSGSTSGFEKSPGFVGFRGGAKGKGSFQPPSQGSSKDSMNAQKYSSQSSTFGQGTCKSAQQLHSFRLVNLKSSS